MNILSLLDLSLTGLEGNSGVLGGLIGAALAFLAGMILLIVIISVGLYIYMSLAYSAIGKKAKLSTPGLAWIPGVGPLIIAFQTSKMHWWPWLLLIGCVIPIVNFIAGIAFMVFAIIWQWKMLEAIGRPGWWVLLCLIPIAGTIVWMVLIGIAAWGKE